MSTAPDDNELLKPREAAAILKVSTDTLEAWRAKRIGPDWLKLGDSPRSPVRYRRGVITTYLQACKV